MIQLENNVVTGYDGNEDKLDIPEGVTEIAPRVFYGCRSITEVSFPSSLKVIRESAFYGCTELKYLRFSGRPGSDEGIVIENHAFSSCSSVTELDLPEGLKRIEQSAFSPCASLVKLVLPESLEYIGEFAFSCCRQLKEVSFPDSLAVIDRSAFSMCSSLQSVVLPRALSFIPRGVFLGCVSLKDISLSVKVSSVENNAFSGCRKLMNIHVDPDNPFLRDEDGVLYSRDGKVLKYFPGGRMDIVIPEKVTEIGDEAFYENLNFDRITLPRELISIGDRAFYGCSELLDIKFPEGLKSLGQSSFERCSKLTGLYIPDSIRSISDSAFRSCKALMWLRLPSGCAFDLHWFCAPNDPPCYSADHTVIPFVTTRDFSDITSEIGKTRAAKGMIMAENAGIQTDSVTVAAYTDHIRANISGYYDEMLSDDNMLRWLTDRRLIPYDDVEVLLERATALGRAGAGSILLDYKNKKNDTIASAPEISLDDRFDALEHALDF